MQGRCGVVVESLTREAVREARPGRSSPPSWGLAVACAVAMTPGILVMIAAFGAFARIYQYVPVVDVSALLAFSVFFAATLFMASRTDSRGRGPEFLLVAIFAGFGLGYFGMGAWNLASMGFLIFTPACLLAYLGVVRTADATLPTKKWWAVTSASLAVGLGLLPAVLVALSLSATTIYLPELRRQIVVASFLALVSSVTLLGLVRAVWPMRGVSARGAATS